MAYLPRVILSPSTSFCQHILVPLISMVFEAFSHVGTKWGHYEKEMPPQTAVGAFSEVPSGIEPLYLVLQTSA